MRLQTLKGQRAMVEELVEASTLKSKTAARILAEQIVAAREMMAELEHKRRTQKLRSEEIRAYPALASQTKRHLEALGITDERDDNDETGDDL